MSEIITGEVIRINNERLSGTIRLPDGTTREVVDPGIAVKNITVGKMVTALEISTPTGVQIGIDLQRVDG